MTLLAFNSSPPEIPINTIEIGYSIIKARYDIVTDYDLASVGGWIREYNSPKNTAVYQQAIFDTNNRLITYPNLVPTTEYTLSLSYLDSFILPSTDLIQSQYISEDPELLNLAHRDVTTLTPITITDITVSSTETAVGNPFASVTIEITGQADFLVIESFDVNNPGAVWTRVAVITPYSTDTLTMLGGTYQIRYSSVKVFSDGTEDVTTPIVYPTTIEVESGLSAPPEVSNGTLAAYKNKNLTSTYDLRVNWSFPSDISSQNRKRNFTVATISNPTYTTSYESLNWDSAVEDVAVSSSFVYTSFPYRSPYVIRIGVSGWGTEGSGYLYLPVFISKDTGDSSVLGYLVPNELSYSSNTKIQIDDEFIRAYKHFDPDNSTNNIKVFEVDANTGNVIIGTAGGVYGGGSVLTTAPFIFDSEANKLQISGRTITDQIESASYVMSWIDAEPPSFRTVGKAGFGSNAAGIWMGYVNPTTFMFDLGDATNYIRWNGTNLTISGTVQIGLDGRTLGQAQKQIFIYRRDVSTPATPTGGTFNSPVPGGWNSVVPSGTDDVYMCSRLFTTDGAPPQDATWSTPSLFSPGAAAGSTASYTWIKYADDNIGTGLSDSPEGKPYIGIAVNKPTPVETTNGADYAWSLLTGEGVPGQDGQDGITTYTWIKYSQFPTGTPTLTDTPDSNTMYIGISTNRDTATESTIATDYVWSKFKGDTGVPGAVTFKSTVFVRQTATPSTPTGGTFASPIPTSGSWSDGIPGGSLQLWASTRVFSQDGLAPQQSVWTAPVAMTSTSLLEINYSTVSSSPGTPTTNPGNWTTTASTSTIWLAQRSTTNGVVGSWQVSKIKGEAGASGIDGTSAKTVSLTASSMVVSYLSTNVESPSGQSISFSVNRQNISGSTTWSATDNSGNSVTGLLTGTNNTSASLSGSHFSGRKSIKVTATAEGYSDSITIVKVQDGAAGSDSIVGILTNESHSVAAAKDGTVSNWEGVGGTFLVYKGATAVTGASTFSVVSSVNVTGSINASGVYSVTDMSANQGTLTLRAVHEGTSVDKVFSVSKSLAGTSGARGAGQYSAAFSNPTSSITDAMASAATAACPEGIPVPGDVVTLYSTSDTTVSPVTIIYNSGVPTVATSWSGFIVRIDGNLLVTGSVAADKININDLFSKNATITGTLQVGGGSTYTVIDGISGGITARVGGNTVFSATNSGGFLQGRDIAAGSIDQTSLSPELQEWIASVGLGDGGASYGGSESYQGTLQTGIFELDPISCAAGNVQLTLSYGGSSATIKSTTDPGGGYISFRFLKNGVPLTGYSTEYGDSTFISASGTGDVYLVTLPSINVTFMNEVTLGPQVFEVDFIVGRPLASAGNPQWTSSVGTFSFGAFQQPTGSGSGGGGGATTLDGLSDVSTAGAVAGNALVFNGTSWVPGAGSGGGGGGSTLTFGSYLTGGSYNGSSAVTIGVNASSVNASSNLVARDSSGNFSAGTITASLSGNATTANSLTSSRNISMSGDVTWSVSFNGSASVSGSSSLSTTGVSAGTYGSSSGIPVITVDAKGRVTSVSTATVSGSSSLSAYGTTIGPNNSYGMNIQSAESSTYLYLQGGSRGAITASSSGMTFQSPGQSSTLVAMSTSGITNYYTVYAPDFFTTSDISVKKDLEVIGGAVERVSRLSGYTYLRTDMNNSVSAGIIAQDLQSVLPEAVTRNTNTGKLTINNSGVIALLVEAIKEQQAVINRLVAKIGGV